MEHARKCQIRATFVSHLPLRLVRGVLERFGELWGVRVCVSKITAHQTDGLPEKCVAQYNVVYIPT